MVEIIPPCVETDATRGASFPQMSPEEFAEDCIIQLLQNLTEIGYQNEPIITASRDELDVMFNEWNGVVG